MILRAARTNSLVILWALLALPSSAQCAVSVIQWLALYVNTMRAFLLYYFEGNTQSAMANFDDVVTDFTVVLRDFLPESAVIDNMEEPNMLDKGYLCMGEGTVRDLKSIEKIGNIDYKFRRDGSVRAHMYFTIKEFVVHYGSFYWEGLGIKKRGSLELYFKRNTILIGMRIANVRYWLRGRAKCIFRISKLEFVELGGIGVKLISGGFTHGHLSSYMLTQAFRQRKDFLEKALKKKLLRRLYKKIKTGNLVVCTDPGLDRQVKELKALKELRFSEQFESLCGGGNGISLRVDEDDVSSSSDKQTRYDRHRKYQDTRDTSE